MRFSSRFLLVSTIRILITTFALGLIPIASAEAVKIKPVKTSADKRFEAFADGTIHDVNTGLMWMSNDYWQMEHKWVNWYTAKEYVQRMNNKKFAGYSDWRLPTVEEASSLYERRKRNIDKDGDKIFIDRMFPKGSGWSTWTNEEKQGKALVVSFKDEGGKSYQDKITATDAFLRLVRGPISQE
ncbi:MAG TPA: DUF1566 domain-containing protein [Nitrospinaceae bacterium]|nr:DUF1566 domain-containing protein [Nitrospinaceae bacterium]